MRSNYRIGEVVHSIDVRNNGVACTNLLGLSMTKEFRPSTSNIVGTDLSKYKIVGFNQFAVDFMSTIRVHRMPIALNRTGENIIVSPAYGVFAVNDEEILLPEYLMLWFSRPDFDRYAEFRCDSAIRGGYDWDALCDTEIDVPPLSEQRKIVHDYQVIAERIEILRKINETLEELEEAVFLDICLCNDKEDWRPACFDDLIVNNTSGDWGADVPEGNKSARVICIRGTDIPELCSGIASKAPVRFILEKNVTTKQLSINDMIIEISGGSPVQSTGRIALLTKDIVQNVGERLICSNFCKAITVRKDYLYFFYLYWRHLYKTNRLFDYENSTITLKNFDFSSFTTQEPIKLPPADISRHLNSVIEPIHRSIINNGIEIDNLSNLRATVLPHFFA